MVSCFKLKYQGKLIILIQFLILVAPYECGMGLLITIAGVPFYYLGVARKEQSKWFQDKMVKATHFCQKLFMAAKEEQDFE